MRRGFLETPITDVNSVKFQPSTVIVQMHDPVKRNKARSETKSKKPISKENRKKIRREKINHSTVEPRQPNSAKSRLFRGRRVLGDSLEVVRKRKRRCWDTKLSYLSALRHSVLGKLARQNQANRCLNLARRDGRLLVVRSQLGSFGSNALEDIIDERVQNRHRPVRDTGIRMDLFQYYKLKSEKICALV